MECKKCGTKLTEDTATVAASFFQINGSDEKIQVVVECDLCHAEMFQLVEGKDLLLAD